MSLFQGKNCLVFVSETIRAQRWKFLVVGLALMILGLKLSLSAPDAGDGFLQDYARDNDWDVIAARSISFVCLVLALLGFKSKFDRAMFSGRFKSKK
ncbi:MAG: hypothetical protein COB04_04095 [Gammaproteobacteria bacterium]|nr:MAG: hypothetical protein COB04_04095 [Gammaproteobacteria bacterium]